MNQKSLGRNLLLPLSLSVEIDAGKGKNSRPGYAGMNTCTVTFVERKYLHFINTILYYNDYFNTNVKYLKDYFTVAPLHLSLANMNFLSLEFRLLAN